MQQGMQEADGKNLCTAGLALHIERLRGYPGHAVLREFTLSPDCGTYRAYFEHNPVNIV
jgi:hypothetical protein